MAGGLILDIGYGIDVQSLYDPFLVIVERTMEALGEAGKPGLFLVDSLPLCALPERFESYSMLMT
jgi:hypothetical protein